MNRPVQQKSTFETWQRWAKVLQRQMDQVADVYEYHEEGTEAQRVNAFIDRLKLFIDPLAHAPELAKRNYDVKGSVSKLYLLSLTMLQGYFREALSMLPSISEDMQRILKSPYQGECNGRLACDIFKGPYGTTNEGIASGVPDESGGLPWMLYQLLDQAEREGDGYFMRGLESDPRHEMSIDGEQGFLPDRQEPVPAKSRRLATSGGFE